MFSMGNPCSSSHQVDLTRLNQLDAAHAVAVLDFSLKKPGHCLQASVGVGA
jgi:hypothetical protein